MKYSSYTIYSICTRLLINDFKMMILKGSKMHKRAHTRSEKQYFTSIRPPNKIAFPFQLCLIKKVFFLWRTKETVWSCHYTKLNLVCSFSPERRRERRWNTQQKTRTIVKETIFNLFALYFFNGKLLECISEKLAKWVNKKLLSIRMKWNEIQLKSAWYVWCEQWKC